ncbi:MAG: flavodoxin family protein [Methanothrix sp.]
MPKIAIIYGSGLGRTKKMAEAIANGAMTIEGVEVLLKDAYDTLPNDVADADAVVLGGSTYNYKLIKSMDPVLKEMAKLDLKEKWEWHLVLMDGVEKAYQHSLPA